MIIEKQCDDAYVIKDIFTPLEIYDIAEEISGPYHPLVFKKEYNTNPSDPQWLGLPKKGGSWNGYEGLGDNPLLLSHGPKLTLLVKKILKPDFPNMHRRINTNQLFKYQDNTFHYDCFWVDRDETIRHWTWTFLMFAQDHWDTSWGGEFCYQTSDGNYHYIPYIPGNCVLFNGWLQHKGAAPNSLGEDVRISCAWTFICPDPNVDWRTPQ